MSSIIVPLLIVRRFVLNTVIVCRGDDYLITDDLLTTTSKERTRGRECDDPGHGAMGRTDPAPVLFTKPASALGRGS